MEFANWGSVRPGDPVVEVDGEEWRMRGFGAVDVIAENHPMRDPVRVTVVGAPSLGIPDVVHVVEDQNAIEPPASPGVPRRIAAGVVLHREAVPTAVSVRREFRRLAYSGLPMV